MSNQKLNILCISRFFKGGDFLKGVKDSGHNAYLLTSEQHKTAEWPWEHITEAFYMVEDSHGMWNRHHLLTGLSYKMRTIKFDAFVSLDDFDVEQVALLREHFRIPGMGETTARFFRDKLAMRIQARDNGIPVPEFSPLFNDNEIKNYTAKVSAPWVVKPRMQASAAGIKKVNSESELWAHLEYLGDERHEYLIEKFAPGTVFHVDSLTYENKVIFARSSSYLETPLEVAHGGGVFRSATLDMDSKDDKELKKLNSKVMSAFGMKYSASHTEFIKCTDDGKYYFLETSCRVGGANLAEMVEIASGINLWYEWAKIECSVALKQKYQLPVVKSQNAGIVVSLIRNEWANYDGFIDPEISWKMNKKRHIGIIVQNEKRQNIIALLDKYTEEIRQNFHASMPAKEKLVGGED